MAARATAGESGPVTTDDPAQAFALADEVSVAFLLLLEQRGPEERAAFLLKEAFDHSYQQIGELIGHSEANCRQLVRRTKLRLQAGNPRFKSAPDQHRQLLARFMDAAQSSDRNASQALLLTNATLVFDGGGVATAAIRRLLGAERIGRLYWAILRFAHGKLASITPIEVVDGRITALYSVLNPGKLPALVTTGSAGACL